MLSRFSRVSWAGVVWGLAAGVLAAESPSDDGRYRWFSLPIEVRGLPAGGGSAVPVSCPVDFSAILARLKMAGAVDERSLHLERVVPGGKPVAQPVQFSAEGQPRAAGRRLLPGTAQQVSYLGEYPATEAPPVKVAGRLTWLACAGAEGPSRYTLWFGVPRSGRAVQVPFPPQNLRFFDDQGRAMPLRDFPRLQIRPQWPLDDRVHIYDDRQLVTSYHLGPWSAEPGPGPRPIRRPFLYPVNGPDGVSLTEFGKPHDPTGSHAHHYSLWIAHANVAGRDFWSERGGAIVHGQMELQEDGPVFCRLVQTTRWIHQTTPLLHERRTLTVFAEGGGPADRFRLIDVELEFTPAGSAVELGKTTFGFLAARVAQSMTPFDGGGEILNARGDRNEHAVHLRRAEWLDQSGPIRPGDPGTGRRSAAPVWGGIAILDHPSNPNHPTVWHCRNDGWAGASVTAEAPSTIPAGGALRLRYRIHLHRGTASDAAVARRYAEYAAQPTMRLGDL